MRWRLHSKARKFGSSFAQLCEANLKEKIKALWRRCIARFLVLCFEINSKVRKYQDILNNNYILEETLPGLFILIHALKSNFTRNEIEGNMRSYDLTS